MYCEHCQQREAAIVMTATNNGQKTKQHLCHECATNLQTFHVELQDATPLQQLLTTWFGTPAWQQQEQKEQRTTACAHCQLTFQQFLKDGKFGCPSCYDAFHDELPPLLKRLQSGIEHVGKVPHVVNEKMSLKKRIELIRQTMKTAVEEERFEDAAKLRDEARALEAQLLGGDNV